MLGARVQQMNGWCAELQFAAACDPAPHMRILPSEPGVAALRKGDDHTKTHPQAALRHAQAAFVILLAVACAWSGLTQALIRDCLVQPTC